MKGIITERKDNSITVKPMENFLDIRSYAWEYPDIFQVGAEVEISFGKLVVLTREGKQIFGTLEYET
jgi:hypothetical protein